jgi:hypothetical protein
MLQAVRHFRQLPRYGGHLQRLPAALRSSRVARKLVRNRRRVADALAWCGWVLAGGVVLFAAWELGGFAVLLGPESFGRPQVHQPARIPPVHAPAQDRPGGCTQAALDRATGLTVSVRCRRADRA